MELDEILTLAREAGFSAAAPLNCSTLELKQEVRDMCRSNGCGQYGRRWSCPPGCGSLEECRARLGAFSAGILVQTVGRLEDEFDGEGMMAAEARHKEIFSAFLSLLRQRCRDVLPLGAGCCTRCRNCTYPQVPCRFPEAMTSSMEAYGMLVSEVCSRSGVPYYYGPNTIAYTGCYLLR